MFDVPILLLVWRRADLVSTQLAILRRIKPSLLFVSCDGPRDNDPISEEQVARVRSTLENEIDWQCNVVKRFNAINMGCKTAIIEALGWFFENVDEGIILEDDCIPDEDFFLFCKELLDKYRFKANVYSIGGFNPIENRINPQYNFAFTSIPLIWGWATWKRSWINLRMTIDWLESSSYFQRLYMLTKSIGFNLRTMYWSNVLYQLVDKKNIDTWDYQNTMSCLFSNSCHIVPVCSIISNLGIDQLPTHSSSITSAQSAKIGLPRLPSPSIISLDRNLDQRIFTEVFVRSHKQSLAIILRWIFLTISCFANSIISCIRSNWGVLFRFRA